ncbi:MAG: hypothetical protein J0L72_07890 [Armatimonadetes bacterium]|nr:hypothetical protein [Armatimonadota bacterium]
MHLTIHLPELSEECALVHVITFLRSRCLQVGTNSRFSSSADLYIPEVVKLLCDEQFERLRKEHSGQGMFSARTDLKKNSEPLYAAAWHLVLRGVLSPNPSYPMQDNGQVSTRTIGADFSITEFGRKWLSETNLHECLPNEHSRFSQLLYSHSTRFGSGFFTRSKEALACYQARIYFACCAMCGAATESILLALAIARLGNEEEVLKQYRTGSGRSKIERIILANQNGVVTSSLANYTGLLHYWRDESAHGANTALSEDEAFTALILLLRFANFADQRWSELTSTPSKTAM